MLQLQKISQQVNYNLLQRFNFKRVARAPELTDYNASTSYDLSIFKSMNDTTSMSYNLPADVLLTKKALNLKDLQKVESFSLSTTGQLETHTHTVNNSTSTVKTTNVLLASEGKAAVSDSKACVV
ncbi:hypothetical protein TNCV_1198271 [Trichonephila clavipes]|uniref:Uncharacterized protein n=1 Tax=Trichonephila clavipes TaxID=2585209 RepID=A0A8X6RZH6_TRICX|nr:hypothetical protein TNCV_1198271 [Trichonephila clavipes]